MERRRGKRSDWESHAYNSHRRPNVGHFFMFVCQPPLARSNSLLIRERYVERARGVKGPVRRVEEYLKPNKPNIVPSDLPCHGLGV